MAGGMEFEFTADTGELVGALEAGAGAAEDFERAMDGARDANAEFGASTGDAAASVAAEAAGLEAAAASMKRLRDEKGRFVSASKVSTDGIRAETDAIRAAREEATRLLGEQKKIIGVAPSGFDSGLRRAEIDSRAAALGMEEFRQKIEDLRKTGREAEAGINDLQRAVTSEGGGTRRRVAVVSAFHGLKSGVRDLKELEKEAKAAGGGRGGILSSLFGALASGGTSAVTSLKGTVFTPMAGLIAGVAGLAAGAVPAVLSLGGGFTAFGAMAAPALLKVKKGLSDVTYAQQQYQLARGIAQRDPTKSNLEDEAKALAALKTTWAQMPAPIAGAVSGVRQFEKAWSAAGRKSGIQKAALGDIRLIAKDAQAAIPAVTGLAKAAEPIIHGGLQDLGTEFKSKGFKSWVKDLEKDMGPAAHALKGIGSDVGGFITQLTSREAKPGTQMLTNIGKFLHTITPGTITGLTGLTKGISGLFSAMNTAAKSKLMSETVADFKIANKFLHGLGIGGTVKQAEAGLAAQANKYTAGTAEAHLKGVNITRLVHFHYKVAPEAKEGDLASALNQSQQLKAHAATVPVRVKADGGDIAKQVQDAAKTGGAIPLKGKVTLTGLKAGIQSQVANLHIPDSKVKVSIQVTGAGQAKAAMSQVVGAARKDAAGAAAALSGLGHAGSAAGAAMDAGLAAGINAGAGEVAAAAKHVAGIAAAAMAAEAQIHSPSRVTQKIGQQLDAGLEEGLLGGKSEVAKAAALVMGHAIFKDQGIAAAVRRMRAEVRVAFHRGDISGHQRDSYIDFIDRGNRRLLQLAQQRAKIEQQIHAATALAASVTQNAIEGGGGIVGYGQAALAAKNAGKPSGTIQQQQQTQLDNIKKFRHEIIQLKREGLDKRDIRDIEKAGISGGGMATAQQLLGQGPAAVRQTAKLEKEIEKEARKLGVTGANAAYESGSQVGKGLAAGLRSELKGVEQAMQELARHLVNELRKDLGLPPLPKDGGGKGGGGHRHHPKHHGGGGGGGLQMYPGGPLHGVAPVREHPGVIHNHIRLEVDGREMATVVQVHSLRRARRNTATGLKPANRNI